MIRYFYPHLERLEVRRLLAGDIIERMTVPANDFMAEDVMVDDVAVDEGMTDDIAVDIMAMAMSANLSPVFVSAERHDNGMLVVVGVTEAGHSPHHVSVIGGPSAWTDADGYVRFQMPSGTRLLELKIANDQGLNAATVRLEFDESGRLASQFWETHDETLGEGESDKLASLIGSLLNHDAHANMALDMPAMAMDDHQVVHVPGVGAAMVVSHATTHGFDFAVTRNRMSDHSPVTPNTVAARANSSGDATGSTTDESASMGSNEHGDAGGSVAADGDGDASHDSEVAGDEPAGESASSAGNKLASVSPSLLATLIADDVANASKQTVAATYLMGQSPQSPQTQPSIEVSDTTGTPDTTGTTENVAAEPTTVSDQASSHEGRTWFVLKIAATSLLSAAAAVIFERRAHSIARERQRAEKYPRVE